jgi:hypothetical protein
MDDSRTIAVVILALLVVIFAAMPFCLLRWRNKRRTKTSKDVEMQRVVKPGRRRVDRDHVVSRPVTSPRKVYIRDERRRSWASGDTAGAAF